jgi:hypothetical protein
MAAITEQISDTTIAHMQKFYNTLSEKDQRRFAAFEAQRLGHGGITYIAELLGCSTKTISRGIEELNQLLDDPAAGRIRRQGAGRKKVSRQTPK